MKREIEIERERERERKPTYDATVRERVGKTYLKFKRLGRVEVCVRETERERSNY